MLSSNYKIKKAKDPLLTQIVTRKGYFAGLSFKVSKNSDIKKSNYLSTVPNVSFSFDYTRVIFDYGHSQNTNDKELINSLFKNMAPGTVFSVSDASFLIESNTTSANLGGNYIFMRLIGDAIVAKPSTITSINNRITIYENKFFTTIPQFSSTIPINTNEIVYTITNSLLSDTKNSFINFGIYPNDTIKIKGTVNNDRSFKVLSVNKNSDGSETMVVETEIVDEVTFGNNVVLELVQSGNYKFEEKDTIYDSSVGSCLLLLSDNSTTCFNNQTENQCEIRSSEKFAQDKYWTLNGICTGSEITSRTSSTVNSARRRISLSSIISSSTRSLNSGTNQTTTQAI